MLRTLVLLACLALPARAESPRARFIAGFLSRYHAAADAPVLPPGLAKQLSDAALAQTLQRVTYDPSYVKLAYPGGDVPSRRGVCTDVVIRAFRKVGVDLQVDVHEDMAAHFAAYPAIYGRKSPDTSIDHRRVPNLMVFFSRRGTALPISDKPQDYRPGDVVAWDLGGGLTHVGLVVDKKVGERYEIVHNIGYGPQLDDALFAWKIIGHFRYAKAAAAR